MVVQVGICNIQILNVNESTLRGDVINVNRITAITLQVMTL